MHAAASVPGPPPGMPPSKKSNHLPNQMSADRTVSDQPSNEASRGARAAAGDAGDRVPWRFVTGRVVFWLPPLRRSQTGEQETPVELG